MPLFDVFFGSDRISEAADYAQLKAEEALAAYDEREAKDLTLHVERCAKRWGLVRAGQRQQIAISNRNGARTLWAFVVIGVLILFRDSPHVEAFMHMIGL